MEFLLKFKISDLNQLNLDGLINDNQEILFNKINVLEKQNKLYKEINFQSGKAIIIGDPINLEKEYKTNLSYLERKDIGSFVRAVDGFYFLIVLYYGEKKIIAACSIFNILPIYYSQINENIVISSSLSLLKNNCPEINFSVDHQYYLEKALFNYPLLDRTQLKEVKIISSNSFLEIENNTITKKKHTHIHNYFTETPRSWRASVNDISDHFIDCAKSFLPQEKFIATLTGGFDGRVVVGLALSEKKDFETYSYGSAEDLDVILPKEICKKINIKYNPLILDNEFAVKHYWKHAQEFVKKSDGLGNFSRAHYDFAADTILKNNNYLITGNFGSELIRAMKVAGVMISEFGFDLFRSDFKNKSHDKIKSFKFISYLNPELVSNTLESMQADIYDYLNSMPKHLSENQKFYIFIFEEVFRKYFGPEITIQRKKINNRSPFMCFKFIKELLQTEFSGAYSRLQESNPLNRYHGQVLYPYIIKKTYPGLNNMYLDRGYKPKDFLNQWGISKIMLGHIRKKYLFRRDTSIPTYSKQIIDSNVTNFKSIKIEGDIFNTEYFKIMNNGGWNEDHQTFLNMNSAAYFLNVLNS